MPDISLCTGIKYTSVCPKKESCYRHMAIPCEYRQSYFMNAPFEIKEDMTVNCEYFWQIEKTDRLRKKDENG